MVLISNSGISGSACRIWPRMVDLERVGFGKALKAGVLISYGTDVGGYAWTENQAKEFAYMVRYGMTPMAARRAPGNDRPLPTSPSR